MLKYVSTREKAVNFKKCKNKKIKTLNLPKPDICIDRRTLEKFLFYNQRYNFEVFPNGFDKKLA